MPSNNLGGKGIGKEIVCYGKKYNSWSELIKEYNIPHSSGWYALSRGDKPEDIVERYKNKKGDRLRKKKTLYEYKGKEYSLKQLAEMSEGLSEATIYQRIKDRKWTVERAVETPKLEHVNNPNKNRENFKKYTYLGQEMTMQELSELSGIHRRTIETRLESGWALEDALEQEKTEIN